MTLRDWLRSGWLIEHETTRQEIANLLHVADRDLLDCRSESLSPDWQLNIAYNAALQTATAALAAAGYRAPRDAHHYRVIQSLMHTIGAERRLVARFEQFRKKRNIGEYERAGLVSSTEADEMIILAAELRGQVESWIRLHHPHLLT